MEQITTICYGKKDTWQSRGGTSLLPESDGRFGRKRAGEMCHHIYTALSGND